MSADAGVLKKLQRISGGARQMHLRALQHPDTAVAGIVVGTGLDGEIRISDTISLPWIGAGGEDDSTSLIRVAEATLRTLERQSTGLDALGWYCSSPGSNAALSDRDRDVTSALFSDPLQVMIVIDPVSEIEAIYGWRSGSLVQISSHPIRRGTRSTPAVKREPAVVAPASTATPAADQDGALLNEAEGAQTSGPDLSPVYEPAESHSHRNDSARQRAARVPAAKREAEQGNRLWISLALIAPAVGGLAAGVLLVVLR